MFNEARAPPRRDAWIATRNPGGSRAKPWIDERASKIAKNIGHRARQSDERVGIQPANFLFAPTRFGFVNGRDIWESHLLKCRCPRANGMSMGAAVGAVNMWSSKSSSLFPWSLFVEDIVLMMFSLLSDRDSVSLPESPELRDEYPLQSRPSPTFGSSGNESRRASGLDTSGGLVLLLARNPCICSLASNPMTRSAGTDKTRRIAVPSQ